VDCAAKLLGKSACHLTLCHVIKSLGFFEAGPEIILHPEHETEWEKVNQERIQPALAAAQKKLTDAGLPAERISTRILANRSSRAMAIVEEAKIGRYGSIVLGRRGLSVFKEFFLGSVSKKVLSMAEDKAVWIVS
jgi:nucleotide-binding universal stress UspA family protein